MNSLKPLAINRSVLFHFVIPAKAGIQIFLITISGFPFPRLRAEALWRASTGMTEFKFQRKDCQILSNGYVT